MVNYRLISLALTCSQIFRRDIRASSELTQAEAVKALGFLKQKATEQKVAA